MPRTIARIIATALLLNSMLLAPSFVLTESAQAGVRQQIFPLSKTPITSSLLGATGLSAYISTAQGTNRGFLLTASTSGSLASRIGLEVGDVLLNINGHVIDSGSQADRVLGDMPSGPIHCAFVKQGEQGLALYNQTIGWSNSGNRQTAYASSHGSSGRSSFGSSSGSAATTVNVAAPQLESYVADLVNADRKANGLPTLSYSGSLAKVAHGYAGVMAATGCKEHVDPDGHDPSWRGKAGGLNVPWVGENLGWATGFSPQECIKKIEARMMAEPANEPHNHRGNILNPHYVAIGCGVAINPKTGEFNVVQDFCIQQP